MAKKKKYKVVVNNTPTKNKLLLNPVTGLNSFGTLPELKSDRYFFPSGEIYLRYGYHWVSPNDPKKAKGFGLKHSWDGHKDKGLIAKGYRCEDMVRNFVADVLQPGAAIYSEGVTGKLQIVNSNAGMVIIAEREVDREIAYHVITAYFSKAKGARIGTL